MDDRKKILKSRLLPVDPIPCYDQYQCHNSITPSAIINSSNIQKNNNKEIGGGIKRNHMKPNHVKLGPDEKSITNLNESLKCLDFTNSLRTDLRYLEENAK